MRVLVGMETSGQVRDAFLRLGHDAISVDLLPHQYGGPHVVGDLFDFVQRDTAFDLAIFHPECTYHTLAAAWAFGPGPYHQQVKPGTLTGQARHEARARAEDDVRRIRYLPIPRKVIENPRGTIPQRLNMPVGQVIHPRDFGDDASKATCLWFYDAHGEPLTDMALNCRPAARALPRLVCKACGATTAPGATATACGCVGQRLPRWENQTDKGQNRVAPHVTNRWQVRSDTFPGVAAAMAEQWGSLPPPFRTTLF